MRMLLKCAISQLTFDDLGNFGNYTETSKVQIEVNLSYASRLHGDC